MNKTKILRIEVLEESGFPLMHYDMQSRKIIKDIASSNRDVLKSSLLVAAIQGLSETGTKISTIETEEEKYLLVKKKNLILVLVLPKDADAYSEKLHLFAHSLVHGLVKLHEKMGLSPGDISMEEYYEKMEKPFNRLMNLLISKIGLK